MASRGLINRVYEAFWDMVRNGDCPCNICKDGPYYEWFAQVGRVGKTRKLHFTLKEMCEALGYDYELYKDRTKVYQAIHAAIDHFYTKVTKSAEKPGLVRKYYARDDVKEFIEKELEKGREETEVMEQVWTNGFIPSCVGSKRPWVPFLHDDGRDAYMVPDYVSFVSQRNESLRIRADTFAKVLRERHDMRLPVPDGSPMLKEAHDKTMGYLEAAGANLTKDEKTRYSLPSAQEEEQA